jgi:hypothetical protein
MKDCMHLYLYLAVYVCACFLFIEYVQSFTFADLMDKHHLCLIYFYLFIRLKCVFLMRIAVYEIC